MTKVFPKREIDIDRVNQIVRIQQIIIRSPLNALF